MAWIHKLETVVEDKVLLHMYFSILLGIMLMFCLNLFHNGNLLVSLKLTLQSSVPLCYVAVFNYSDVRLSILEVADVALVDCLEFFFISFGHNHVVTEVVITDLPTLVYALERYVEGEILGPGCQSVACGIYPLENALVCHNSLGIPLR